MCKRMDGNWRGVVVFNQVFLFFVLFWFRKSPEDITEDLYIDFKWCNSRVKLNVFPKMLNFFPE